MPITRAGDIDLEYYVQGSGPPLLMLMGFTGQAASWGEPFVEHLRPHFTCIRVSNRGTGQSTQPTEQFTIRTMADDAASLMEAIGIKQSHVLGVSMGGMIAQEYALAYPERVNGLVLGCTATGGPNTVQVDASVVQLMAPTPGLSREEMVRKAWPAICSPAFIESSRDFLEKMLQDGSAHPTPLDVAMKQMVAITGFDVYDKIPAIKAPTLVIHGDADRLVPAPNGRAVAERIPGAELRILPGAAHMFFWEQPREGAAAIVEFLARVPARA